MSDKSRVLLVDDQADVLKLLGMFFERAGFDVETAVDGPKALEKVAANKPDIIILDVMMPGMSGIEVCKKLRSQSATAQIPIILLSAKGELDDKVIGFEAGADDYVTKPVARQELMARANALLTRAQYTADLQSARVITFVGAKGGVGVTTVAINVAATLAADNKTVSLVELQAHPGTMIHHLNMDPAKDLGELLAHQASAVNPREINRLLIQHSTGFWLLPSPQSEDQLHLSSEHARTIINALIPKADYLLLDVAAITSEATRTALELADQIILITEPEPASIKSAKARLETLRNWQLSDRVKVVVVNRSFSATMIGRDEVETALGIASGINGIISMVQPMPEAFQQASQSGIPVVISKPQILPSRSLQELAGWLVRHAQGS